MWDSDSTLRASAFFLFFLLLLERKEDLCVQQKHHEMNETQTVQLNCSLETCESVNQDSLLAPVSAPLPNPLCMAPYPAATFTPGGGHVLSSFGWDVSG